MIIATNLRPSRARTNLLEDFDETLPDSSDDDFSSETILPYSFEDLTDVKELYRTTSNSSIDSCQYEVPLVTSKTNLFVPSASFSGYDRNYEYASSPLSSAQNFNGYYEDKFDLNFTRSQLIQRLQNLVKMACQNFNGDMEV